MSENRSTIRVFTWQVQDAFGQPESLRRRYNQNRAAIIKDILFGAEGLRPDVMVFPSAYQATRRTEARSATRFFSRFGFSVKDVSYGDLDGRADQHGMIMAVNKDLLKKEIAVIQMAGRSSLMATVGIRDTEQTERLVSVYGAQLNDRSRAMRRWGVQDMAYDRDSRGSTGEIAMIVGSINALENDARLAGTFRLLGRAVKHLPRHEPGTPLPPWPLKLLMRASSVMHRQGEMAYGDTMQLIFDNGFEDADAQHQPTAADPDGIWHHPISQLDRIMHTDQLAPVGDVKVGYYPDVSTRAYVMADISLRAV